MSLDVGSALRYGADRLVERNGLQLVALFAVVGLLGTIASQTLSVGLLEMLQNDPQFPQDEFTGGVPGVADPETTPLALPGGFALGLGLTLVGAVLTEAVRIVSDRTLVSDRTDRLYEPTRNLALATVFGIVAGIIAGVAVLIGLVLLVVPGVYIALGLFFFRQEIAVFDKGPVDALADSWSLAKGHRLELLGLAVALAIISLVVSGASGLISVAVPQVVSTLVGVVVGAVLSVFASGSVAGAYRQLLAVERDDTEVGLSTAATGYGDIDEEWR